MKSSLPHPSTFLRTCMAALLLATAAASSSAADWPAKPITLVVPFVAGGTTDIVARTVGQKLSEALKQPVIIDNRGGAGGTVGAAIASKAPADGYTLFMATIAHSIAPGLYKRLPYDFQRDFDPVALVASTPNVLIVNEKVPVKSVAELVAYIKANPGKVNYGSAGNGSTEHISGELFRSMTKTDIVHVPYKGGAPMMADLMGGQIQMAIETSPSAAPHIRAGKVQALAVTTKTRSPAYPGVPTLDEAGLKGYDMTTWFALMAPHGTPPELVQRLNTEVSRVLQQSDVVKRFEEQGVTGGSMKPAELATFIGSETTKWVKVAKDSGATAE
ncbi:MULTISPECIES: tripartite tricarboxylate transporter substrate binding protein [Variovorax]|jgi:tripartite-type tricarboxylate transporter receptor subunit TctC|uniref:tripartite tricarboxylate transporter substrate binding protein n=1 Tax=Variovorax TaxID=34072 RepID=UPI0008C78338|nr:tripartite tricarboxylate transporter substrate binding protein [Variovorax sp. OV084]SES78038.1 Tripartite-type tricarboxylate transporter, receptor component TctC [Variovorax sp. OV084]